MFFGKWRKQLSVSGSFRATIVTRQTHKDTQNGHRGFTQIRGLAGIPIIRRLVEAPRLVPEVLHLAQRLLRDVLLAVVPVVDLAQLTATPVARHVVTVTLRFVVISVTWATRERFQICCRAQLHCQTPNQRTQSKAQFSETEIIFGDDLVRRNNKNKSAHRSVARYA